MRTRDFLQSLVNHKFYIRLHNCVVYLVWHIMMKYSLPQEIEVWYIIPALRRELAKAMLSLGLKQNQIAVKLGLRESAISQYLNSKRGQSIKFNALIQQEISKSAQKIANNSTCVMKEIQDLCKTIKKSKFLCQVHKKYSNINYCCGTCAEE